MNLIQRVLIMKRMGPSKKKNIQIEKNNHELFEPDPCRKEEEKEFYKSGSNFFKGEEGNENSINNQLIQANSPSTISQTKANKALEVRNLSYSEEYIKNEINESNRIKNYLSTGGTGGNENRPEANLNISETDEENVLIESPEKDTHTHRSSANEELEYQTGNAKNGNLSQFLNNKKSIDSDNLYNYMDEISVESLNSDDKF